MSQIDESLFTTPAILTRCPSNPVLASKDVPGEPSLVFNAGVCKYQGKYVMVYRCDDVTQVLKREDGSDWHRFKTWIGIAYSDDGIKWEAQEKPCFALSSEEILRAYDPRLTVIDGKVVMCFAVDTKHGVRGGIAVTEDFENFDIKTMTVPDNRNMVLFPEKINDMYVRLERPFPVYSRGKDRFDLWASRSPDLRYWGDHALVLAVEDVPFANDKIGPAAPPIKTKAGWLTTFHAVDRDDSRGKNGWEPTWKKRYTGGIMLLDLQDPTKVVGIYNRPLINPETPYESDQGFRQDVIFPGGMVLEDSGEVKIYYGAADTVEALATAHVDDLIALCTTPVAAHV
ncbi:MAG TPA: glycosidase [Phycisphaerales bacterium]|nr:glycosidase [Phycisphaerales bacterium]HCD33283.1 glycosidase [Phycisphaerales bacterium]